MRINTCIRTSTHSLAHLQPSHSASVGENVTVSRGCLSGGDRFDGWTWPLPLHSLFCGAMCVCVCVCVFLTVMRVVFDWRGTMGDASVPRGAQPDVHRTWHCRASGVTGMWQGRAGPKWLFRLDYPAKTLDMPSPISHFPFMVTEPFAIHKWSADCTLPFTQYRLITHRCKLARTKIRQPPTIANQRKGCWEWASSSGD